MKGLFASFRFAWEGLKGAFRTERNVKIHGTIAILVLLCGIYFRLTPTEWGIVFLAIGGMVCAELMNTAIERVVDMVVEDYHPLAKEAKDIAAAACFVFACSCFVVGMIIFLPKFLSLFI